MGKSKSTVGVPVVSSTPLTAMNGKHDVFVHSTPIKSIEVDNEHDNDEQVEKKKKKKNKKNKKKVVEEVVDDDQEEEEEEDGEVDDTVDGAIDTGRTASPLPPSKSGRVSFNPANFVVKKTKSLYDSSRYPKAVPCGTPHPKVPFFTALSTYFAYGLLIAVGHCRDFLNRWGFLRTVSSQTLFACK